MRAILTVFLLAIWCKFFVPTVTAAAAPHWNTEKAQKLQHLVDRFISVKRAGNRPLADSLSIAIGTENGLLTAAAFGAAGPGQPATPDTIYHVGSLTKPFTAFAALKLVEQGAQAHDGSVIKLSTPLKIIFSGVGHWKNRDGTAITLRNLLTMTSTLPNLTSRPPNPLDPWGRVPAKHILVALKATYPRPVSSTFEYSNTSYFLLSEVIDDVLMRRRTGPKTYREFLRRILLDKSGMRHTGFVGEPLPRNAKIAKPRYRAKPAFVQPDWLKGSADMRSTASDIYKMNKAMLDGQFLSDTSTKLMFSELNRVTPFDWYGMGWFVRDRGNEVTYSHSGSVPGFTSFNQVTRFRNRKGWLAITVLSNSTQVEGLDILAKDINRLLRDH